MADERYTQSVNAHYGSDDLEAKIIEALRAAGQDVGRLTPNDLAPLDQFHTRGREATLELAERAGLRPGLAVLDVGSGLGGPARTLAAEFGCQVTGLDLTAAYCRVAELLTERTGLSDRVTFRHGSALEMPFPDESFDLVWTQHSSMNIADKERLYAESHRVLRPGGRLALHEIMAGPVGPIHFPVPWAADPTISFLRPPEAVRGVLAATGFTEVAWVDQSEAALAWFHQRAAAAQPTVGLHLVVGAGFEERFRNVLRNLTENRIVIVQAVFDRA